MNKENNCSTQSILDLTAVFGGAVGHIDIACDFPPAEDTLPSDCTAKGNITVHGALDNLSGYMRLALEATVEYETVCARCLKPLDRAFTLAIEKTVAARGTVEDEDADEVVADYIIVADGRLDLRAAVCEQIYLEFPFRHLCSEDCKGLCPKCGKDLNEGECSCPKKEIDPRLEILATLLGNDGE